MRPEATRCPGVKAGNVPHMAEKDRPKRGSPFNPVHVTCPMTCMHLTLFDLPHQSTISVGT